MKRIIWFMVAAATAALSTAVLAYAPQAGRARTVEGRISPLPEGTRTAKAAASDALLLRPAAAALRSKAWGTGALSRTVEVLKGRMEGIGIANPSVTADSRASTIAVQVPKGKSAAELTQLLTRPGVLELRYVPQLDGGQWREEMETAFGRATGYYRITGADGRPLAWSVLAKLFAQPPAFSGADLAPNCTAGDSQYGAIIHFEFTAGKKKAFEQSTRAHLNKRLAIFLDRKLIAAPMINDAIPGVGIIEGKYTLAEAKRIAVQLNSGALPVPLEVVKGAAKR